MFERRSLSLLPMAVLAVACTALGLAWVVEPLVAPVSLPVRVAFVIGGAALVMGAIKLALRQAAAAATAAEKYVAKICELDSDALHEEHQLDRIPVRREDARWREICQRVRNRLSEFARQAEEVEMARAGVEVRLRRVTSERDQLREILTGLSDPVVAVDAFGEIVIASGSAERLLNLSGTNHGIRALEQLDRCQELLSLLTETRRRRVPSQRTGELTLAAPDGKEHCYRVSCRSLAQQTDGSGPGAERGAVAVLTDISSLKAIQKRNAEFVSSVSHEMKAPLSSIRAYVELLVDGEADDDATREEFLGIINNQTDRLQRLIDNLLNLARIEAGVVAVNKAPQSLNERLGEAVRVLVPMAESKDIRLVAEFSELYLGVLADRDMLLQAAINLITNAIKYTHHGGTVVVRSRLHDKEAVFEVADTGVGLSPEDSQKVFEKFYRVRKDREMAQGTGLGLVLVKHIIEDVHGGRIELESELGRGSTFRVVLPGIAQISA
jgi:two-component system phosphate regulon sensor histidine kinase PhoR